MKQRGLAPRRRVSTATVPLTPTVAGSIDQDDAIARGKDVAQRDPHVAQIAARAVQQHDRRRVDRTQLDNMQPSAVDFDEAALRRIRPLDRHDRPRGDDRKHTE